MGVQVPELLLVTERAKLGAVVGTALGMDYLTTYDIEKFGRYS